jgi:thiopeptide-type bacteriocin biosynthesis protein
MTRDAPQPLLPEIVPAGFFVLRTPLLPWEALESWGAGIGAPEASGSGSGSDARATDLEAILAADRALLEGRLRAKVADPILREALFVASPSLDDALSAWLVDGASHRARGVATILVRYLARMTTRSTPFGLFSGCSVGTIGDRTRLLLAGRSAYVRHTRLDMHYLGALGAALEQDPALRESLAFSPSSALLRAAGELRYAEGTVDPKTRERRFRLVRVELSDYIEATIERAASGASAGELARALVEADPDIDLDEARAFVDQLAADGVLVSDLAPPLTGPEPATALEETLRARGRAEALGAASVLGDVNAALDALDHDGLGLPPARYTAIASRLSALPAKTELPRLFQVDLYKPSPEALFGGEPMRELRRAIALTTRMYRPATAHREALRRFREAFTERYEMQEVPLLEALDDERGIGFGSVRNAEPSPLLDALRFPRGESGKGSFDRYDQFLLTKLDALARAGARIWTLGDADLRALEDSTLARLPDAFAAAVTLAASSPEALERGEFKLSLDGLSGPSGAVLLGRFCHGDPELGRRVGEHLRAEEALRPGAIFAEVVHLPEGRLGNILCRPLLRAYEIPYLGRSGAPPDHQIPLQDLRVSVQNQRIVLRSARLGREVLPRLTSAHNFTDASLGPYRFLCTLQWQDADDLPGFTWGALARAPFLPRVEHGRLVLSLAQWNLPKEAMTPLAVEPAAARLRAVRALREDRGLPRWVTVVDNDNVLSVDLENVLHVDSFVALVKGREGVTLQELFPGPDELCARGPEGRFTHQLVVPFTRAQVAHEPAAAPPTIRLRRTFAPGSEWLYAKLFAGTATIDRVLLEAVAPLVAESLAHGDADGWFFVRYSSPSWHVRVRLHGSPSALRDRVTARLARLTEPLLDNGLLTSLQLDTYQREAERYGGDEAMVVSEALFRADSDAVLSALAAFQEAGADARWRFCFVGMHRLLLDLGLDLSARIALLRAVRAGFAEEHRVDGAFEKQLGDKFRAQRAALEGLLAPGASPPVGAAALDARSQAMAPIARQLGHLERKGALTTSLADLAGSYLHMHANRVLRAQHRAQELVLYDFLLRLYESAEARARRGAR